VAEEAGGIAEADVAALASVERLLAEARREAAALREGAALRRLAEAERIADGRANVPGAARFIAEVQVAIGITAAQAGLLDLSERALIRAATLDPSRGIRAAEAPPEVVARAERIARATATAPVGSFEVAASSPVARVFLDDVEIGTAPRAVRAPIGRHVLRIEAPGYLPYGRVIDVLEGERPPVAVRLAPDPIVRAVRALDDAVVAGDLGAVAPAIAGLAEVGVPLAGVYVVEVGSGPRVRGLLVRCAPDCGVSARIEGPGAQVVVTADTAREAHLEWLREPLPVAAPPPGPTPWIERWYVWAVVSALVAGTGVVVGIATDPAEPTPEPPIIREPVDRMP
jgi:hypothetical protein